MKIKVKHCKLADAEHKEEPRIFAHVFHHKDVICVCKAFDKLPIENKTGILWHELGHLLGNKIYLYGPDDEEIMADMRAQAMGIRIWYDKDKIQWACEDIYHVAYQYNNNKTIVLKEKRKQKYGI